MPFLIRLAIAVAAAVANPASAVPPAATAPGQGRELPHKITMLGEADSRPTPIDNPDDVVFIRITINGHDAWAMLDNASDRTIVDLAFARSLGLAIGPVVEQIDLGPVKLDERLVENTDIVIPGQATLSGAVLAVDMQSFSRMAKHPVQAIIGGDYLDHMAVLIQNSRKQMILAMPGDITPRVAVATLPLTDRNRVAAKVNGKPVTLTVDMGYNGTVRLSNAAWARIVPAGAAVKNSATVAMDGVARASRSVQDAKIELGPVSADHASISAGEKLPGTSDGLLGMAFLTKADFILDVDRKTLILIPIP